MLAVEHPKQSVQLKIWKFFITTLQVFRITNLEYTRYTHEQKVYRINRNCGPTEWILWDTKTVEYLRCTWDNAEMMELQSQWQTKICGVGITLWSLGSVFLPCNMQLQDVHIIHQWWPFNCLTVCIYMMHQCGVCLHWWLLHSYITRTVNYSQRIIQCTTLFMYITVPTCLCTSIHPTW